MLNNTYIEHKLDYTILYVLDTSFNSLSILKS